MSDVDAALKEIEDCDDQISLLKIIATLILKIQNDVDLLQRDVDRIERSLEEE